MLDTRYVNYFDALKNIKESDLLTDNNKTWAIEALNAASQVDIKEYIKKEHILVRIAAIEDKISKYSELGSIASVEAYTDLKQELTDLLT